MFLFMFADKVEETLITRPRKHSAAQRNDQLMWKYVVLLQGVPVTRKFSLYFIQRRYLGDLMIVNQKKCPIATLS